MAKKPAAAKTTETAVHEEAIPPYTTSTEVSAEYAAVEVAENTMLGDMMHCVLSQVKAIQKPWEALGETEQEDYLLSIEAQMRMAVKQAVRIILAQERVVISATVNKVVFKDGVKAEVELLPSSPGRHDLADAEGQIVQILIAHTKHLTEGDQNKPKAERDQRDLLEGGDGQGADDFPDDDFNEDDDNDDEDL